MALRLIVDEGLEGSAIADVLSAAVDGATESLDVTRDVPVYLQDVVVLERGGGTGFGAFRWKAGDERVAIEIAGRTPEGVPDFMWAAASVGTLCHELAHYEQWATGHDVVEDGAEERGRELAHSVHQAVIEAFLEHRRKEAGSPTYRGNPVATEGDRREGSDPMPPEDEWVRDLIEDATDDH